MQSSSSFKLEKAAYPVRQVDGGIVIDAPVKNGKLIGRKRPNGSYRRQCGEYVNDAIGIPSYFTNYLFEKKRRITTQNPSPGSVAVLDTGTRYGHVLLMEINRGDGRWVWSESNPDDMESFRRKEGTITELKMRGLLGFTDGLNFSDEKKEVSKWAIEAVEWCKSKGMTEWSNPQEHVSTEVLSHMLFKAGAITQQYFDESGTAYVPKEQMAVVLHSLMTQ